MWAGVIFVHVLWILTGLVYQFLGSSEKTVKHYFEYLINRAQYTFSSVHNNAHKNEILSEDITVVNVLLATFTQLVNVTFQLQLSFTVSIFVISSLTIWVAVNKLIKGVEDEWQGGDSTIPADGKGDIFKKLNLEEIHERLLDLITLADAVNAAWKQLSFYLILEVAIWFSKDLGAVVKAHNYVLALYLAFYILYLSAGVVLSAECSRKVALQNILFFMKPKSYLIKYFAFY